MVVVWPAATRGSVEAPASNRNLVVGRNVDHVVDRVVDEVVGRIVARLALMHDVARWKWNARRPIDDPERERTLIEALVAQGTIRGLEERFLRRFFQAQFEAAKRVQRSDFEAWSDDPDQRFDDVPDLASVQRPRIDRATGSLLDALAKLRAVQSTADASTPNRVANRLRQALDAARATFEGPADALDIATAVLNESGERE